MEEEGEGERRCKRTEERISFDPEREATSSGLEDDEWNGSDEQE